jgi:diguanylate cyclase (GGDEF)-like protein
MSASRIDILLVEDNLADARLLREALREAGDVYARMEHASNLDEAFERIRNESFDVLLLDLGLPGTQGLDTLRRVYAMFSEIPIVVMTGLDDEEIAVRAVQAGAQDYLVKGQVDPRVLLRTLRHAIERHRMITELDLARRREHYLATHDSLTGLPNRQLFFDLLTQSMAYASRYGQWLAVLFLDLDRFKEVNDTLGHDHGDQLLQLVAERLTGCIRSSDTVARLGGDEFIVLLVNVARAQDASTVAGNILDSLSRPFHLGEEQVTVAPSIGISMFPGDGTNAETLVKNADAAMYSSKRYGGASFQFFAPSMRASRYDKKMLHSGLREALQENDFCLYYQPQVESSTGKIVGAEAFLRWQHPQLGVIGPSTFLPLAEEAGLIGEIGVWAVAAACDQARAWQDVGHPPIRIAVNLSPRHLRQPDVVDRIAAALQHSGLPPAQLELEVSEAAFVHGGEALTDVLRRLKALGVRVSIDDFGAAPSSVENLSGLPADAVKIDQALIRGIGANPKDASAVSAAIAAADSLGMDSVAEGVEKRDQLEFLQSRNCRQMQGYYFCQPLPAADFIQLLSEGTLFEPSVTGTPGAGT